MVLATLTPRLELRHIAALMTAVVLLAGAILIPQKAVAQQGEGEMPPMVQVVESPKSFAETVDAFRLEVEAAGWSLLNETNMAGVLSERGYTIEPVIIFDACSGRYSAQILGEDEARPMSAFMPCRVSIYQTSDESVFIARVNSGAFTEMMDPMVADVMAASDAEIAEIIEATIR